MSAEVNQVTIRRLQQVVLTASEQVAAGTAGESASPGVLMAGLMNLTTLGYWLNAEAYSALRSAQDLADILEAARTLKGADVAYEPMYPNFPEQVASASEIELYANAIMHYLGAWVGVRVMPQYAKDDRAALTEEVTVTSLGLADEDDLRTLFLEIATQGQPFSAQDRADLVTLADYAPDTAPEINIKENLAFLAATFGDLDFSDSFKNPTDVLRLAVALSGGDVSLGEPTKFRSFSRAERRRLLGLLDRFDRTEDMARWAERWKRLARHLRVSDYAGRYPQAARMITMVANGDTGTTFNSRVESAIAADDLEGAIALLETRPGEFARRLNELLMMAAGRAERRQVTDAFATVAEHVSLPVLVQLWGYFSSPDRRVIKRRVITIKSGTDQKTTVIRNNRRSYAADKALVNTIEHAIRSHASLDKVYLDAELFGRYAVPLGVRSASTGLSSAGRGSRLPIGWDKNTLRFFIHWHDLLPDPTDPDRAWSQRVDVDLSAFFVNETLVKSADVAYYNLREEMATHSGDITSAPEGAAEFIDIDIEKALAAGWRYVAMTVYSYSRQHLADIPECYAGFMMRAEAQSGEVFEPSTVEHRLDLNSKGQNSTPFVFDLRERVAIWWDNAVPPSAFYQADVRANRDRLRGHMGQIVHARPMMLDTLIALLADEVVDDRADADVVFAAGGDVEPWQMQKVLGLITP